MRTCADGDAAACLADGITAERAHDNVKAAAAFETACNAKAGEACRRLGALVDNAARARALEVTACDLGDGLACAALADRLYFGRGSFPEPTKVPAAWQKALPLLDADCKHGNADACLRLGEQLAPPDYVAHTEPPDPARAKLVYAQAAALLQAHCDKGEDDACMRLGFLYGHGDGVATDAAKELALEAKTCERGFALGCEEAARLYSAHTDTAKSEAARARAVELFIKECDAGVLDSCSRASIFTSDKKQKALLSKRACELGSAMTCTSWGQSLESGTGVDKDAKAAAAAYARAAELSKKSCDGGDGNACGWYAVALNEGNGMKQDPKEAFAYWLKGCELADAGSCANGADAAERHERGADPTKAADLRAKACVLRKSACKK